MVSPSLALVAKLVALLILPCSVRAVLNPTRISWDELRSSSSTADNKAHEELLDALRHVGLVSLVNIPDLSAVKQETLTALAACIQDDPQVAATHVFDDGTVRRTLATHSLPNAVPKLAFRGGDENAASPPSCQHLQDVSTTFRQLVQEVTQAFAARLQGLVLDDGSTTSAPLLLTRGAKETAYLGLTHAVQHGEHLEHFHAYERLEEQQQPETSSSPDDIGDKNIRMPTVDWHLDQGLFLVFTPGLQDGKPSDGFYVQLPDGSQEMVQFEAQDDLIILLGDALHQILNPKLTEPLRIPPHALTVPQGQRVWYGRMVLPPADALVPSMNDLTFGELRHQLIAASVDDNNNPSSLGGCSSPTLQARHLETVDCDPDTQFFCWHRCFNLTADLTPETCQTQNLTLECINDQRQLWNGDHDMAFKPGCVDADTAEVAPKKTVAPTDAPTGSPETSSSVSFSTMMASLVWGMVAAAAVIL